jgi:peroxiredoxin
MDLVTMSKVKLIKGLVLVGIVGGALFYAFHHRQLLPIGVGEAAPDFNLPLLGDGTVTLRNFRHQVVVLNFWATWCPPCVEEAPGLEKFAEQMRDQGVTVIGVSVDQDGDSLQKFVSNAHLSFPVARDPHRAVSALYGTFKFPETYIIDQEGRVAEKVIGATDWQDPRIISFVQVLTRGPGRQGQ